MRNLRITRQWLAQGHAATLFQNQNLKPCPHRCPRSVYSRSRLTDCAASLLCAGSCHQLSCRIVSGVHQLLGHSFPFLRGSRFSASLTNRCGNQLPPSEFPFTASAFQLLQPAPHRAGACSGAGQGCSRKRDVRHRGCCVGQGCPSHAGQAGVPCRLEVSKIHYEKNTCVWVFTREGRKLFRF